MKVSKALFLLTITITLTMIFTLVFGDIEEDNDETRGVIRREYFLSIENNDFLSDYKVYYYDELYRLRRIDKFDYLSQLMETTVYYFVSDHIPGYDEAVYIQNDWVIKEEIYDNQGNLLYEKTIEYYNNTEKYIHRGRIVEHQNNNREYFFKYYYDTNVAEGERFKIEEIAFYDGMGTKFAGEKYFYDRWDRLWIKVKYGAVDDIVDQTYYQMHHDERLLFGIRLFDFYHPTSPPLIVMSYDILNYDGHNRISYIAKLDRNNCVYSYKHYQYNIFSELQYIRTFEGYSQYVDWGNAFEREFILVEYQSIFNDTIVPTHLSENFLPETVNIPSDANPPPETQDLINENTNEEPIPDEMLERIDNINSD